MFILETSFVQSKTQRIYNVLDNPVPGSVVWGKRATRVNCFFHRNAKDRIRYNVTNKRQFTRHDDFERELYNWPWLTFEDVQTLDHFFEVVGFDYKTKTWTDPGERAKKWNGHKFV